MRLIGHLKDEVSAKTFAGYLASVNISNQVEPDSDGWAVWILSEDQLELGQQALATYQQNPFDPKYQKASQVAEALERQRRRDAEKAEKRFHDRDRIWSLTNLAPLTLALIGVCVLVTFKIGAYPNFRDFQKLAIDDTAFGFFLTQERHVWGSLVQILFHFNLDCLPDVRSGEVWRLITPIFIHMGPVHLIVNMLWLRDLGSMIEVRQGTVKLAMLVLVTGVISNLGQYLADGPAFGGMSGVVYGLFGYIWLRGECDPASGLGLSSNIVWMMMIWFFLCAFNIIGNVANYAHGVGLAVGILWGAAPMAKKLFRGSTNE